MFGALLIGVDDLDLPCVCLFCVGYCFSLVGDFRTEEGLCGTGYECDTDLTFGLIERILLLERILLSVVDLFESVFVCDFERSETRGSRVGDI